MKSEEWAAAEGQHTEKGAASEGQPAENGADVWIWQDGRMIDKLEWVGTYNKHCRRRAHRG